MHEPCGVSFSYDRAPAGARARPALRAPGGSALRAAPDLPFRLSPRTRLWVALLAAGQLADVLTTKVDMLHGGVEANQMAARVMAVGGLGLLGLVKMALVAAMASALGLVDGYRRRNPGLRARLAWTVAWRGLQICVLVLTATALHNVAVLAQIQGWLPAVAASGAISTG